ncbi:MAG: hypothetical protein U0270_09305 [Labilithrix sp.]
MLESEIQRLAQTMMLGALLDEVRSRHETYEVLAHWKQGEFHHDVVLKVDDHVLVVATNCNGGVKEVLAFADVPDRWALWHWRCPDVADFSGELPLLLARATTTHYFDPCALLAENARSELRPEARQRMRGGGWERRD